jgi:hypothetical protein
LRATKLVFVSGVIARLLLMAFKFAVPFLIKATTGFSQNASQPDANGWGLIGAWFLVLVGRAASRSPFQSPRRYAYNHQISNAFFYQMNYR